MGYIGKYMVHKTDMTFYILRFACVEQLCLFQMVRWNYLVGYAHAQQYKALSMQDR